MLNGTSLTLGTGTETETGTGTGTTPGAPTGESSSR
jgi:hypothetical protein